MDLKVFFDEVRDHVFGKIHVPRSGRRMPW